MSFKPNTAYKINPEFEQNDARYYLAEIGKNGAFFHKVNDDGYEPENWSYFTEAEINDNILIEA